MALIIFGPLILFALVCVELGIYRKLIKANAVSWDRYKRFLNRDDADPLAMRKTLVEEVIVHKSLWQISKLRWLRHTLIFWGFTVMFMLELAAVFYAKRVLHLGGEISGERQATPYGLHLIWSMTSQVQ